jgi:micrococcal nuclease
MPSILKKSKKPAKLPTSRAIDVFNATYRPYVIGGLAAILAAGGSYYGYRVTYGTPSAASSATAPHVEMLRAIDGDTFELTSGERVRLIGLDAPEIGTCYADESTRELTRLLSGKSLRLQKDVTEADTFGRLLRYVVAEESGRDNTLVNIALIRSGHAFYMSSVDKLYQKNQIKAETEARNAGHGLWSRCKDDPAFVKRFTDKTKQVGVTIPPPNARCTIKGNVSEKGSGKTYFLEHCPNYAVITIDPSKGEQYFCTESSAKKAGFTISGSCMQVKSR